MCSTTGPFPQPETRGFGLSELYIRGVAFPISTWKEGRFTPPCGAALPSGLAEEFLDRVGPFLPRHPDLKPQRFVERVYGGPDPASTVVTEPYVLRAGPTLNRCESRVAAWVT